MFEPVFKALTTISHLSWQTMHVLGITGLTNLRKKADKQSLFWLICTIAKAKKNVLLGNWKSNQIMSLIQTSLQWHFTISYF